MPALVTRTEVAHPAKKEIDALFPLLASLVIIFAQETLHYTLIIEDVLSVGQHAGEDAAEEQAAQTGTDKQKDVAGVENKQHQHSNNSTCL